MGWHAEHEPYRDRRHAGAELARRLGHLKGTHAVVLGRPRGGGVPVAFEVARTLEVRELLRVAVSERAGCGEAVS